MALNVVKISHGFLRQESQQLGAILAKAIMLHCHPEDGGGEVVVNEISAVKLKIGLPAL
jgi:hypothetical protein